MSKELRYDGKVAIVTGAGNGLGKSHALMLAARGAKVVVNDLGGGIAGEGKSSKAADLVVQEIKAAGGEAAANYDSVEDGDKIVQTAMDNYGRVDIIINNAGILRDVSFAKMTEGDWDLIYRVHVKGAFKVTFAAWPYMRDNKYGRIIMTASAAGIYGNFGQANYSMAKLGVTGFANTLALEGKGRNIFVNTIAPIAGSRLTETVLPPELIEALKPEYVSPLVGWLCHESCEETGGLFEVGGGFFSKLRWERTEGKMFRVGRPISVEDVKANWSTVVDFGKSTHPADITSSMQPIMGNIQKGKSRGGNKFIDVDEALGYEFPPTKSSYDERDLALYALGVGAGEDPYNDKDLQLLYEMHGSGFKALPSYGVIPAVNQIITMAKEGKSAPGFNFDLGNLLHGEQYTELKYPLAPSATLTHKSRVKDIFDKGKNAIIVYETKSFDEDGNEVAHNELTAVIRGAGGWGGDRGPTDPVNVAPGRKPDKVVEQKIHDNQALLYRLSGDWNPLHVDPNFAKAFGFEKPILHGLCTLGMATRHVIGAFFPEQDPRFFKSIKVRFADSVYPGETLVTNMWKEGDKVIFECKVKERDKVVISNAAIVAYPEMPKRPEKKKPAAAVAGASASAEPTSADVFTAMGQYVAAHSDLVGQIATVYQFKLTNPSAVYTLDLKNGGGSVTAGETTKPECTLELSDADFMDMCTGKADPQKLYFGGKLKISGNVMASQKLTFLQKIDPQAVMSAAKARAGAGGGAAAPAASAEPISADVFTAIGKYVAQNPDVTKQVGVVYLFKLNNPASEWTVDLKDGKVVAGAAGKPECTLDLSDSDFMDMCTGKADPQKLYFGGKLKISGNIMASQKLEFLGKLDPKLVLDAAKARAGSGGGAKAPVPAASDAPSSWDVFIAMGDYVSKNPDLVKNVGVVFQFQLTDPASLWTLDLKSGSGSVSEGETVKPECTLTISDADFMDMCTGKADPQKLYFGGKLKIGGNIMASQKLTFLQKIKPEDHVDAVLKARAARGSSGTAAAAAPAASKGPSASVLFEKLKSQLSGNPGLVDEVSALMQWHITGPDSSWVVDLKKGSGNVEPGTTDKADVVFRIAESDFLALVSGGETVRNMYQHGQLKVDGDVLVAQRLGFLKSLS